MKANMTMLPKSSKKERPETEPKSIEDSGELDLHLYSLQLSNLKSLLYLNELENAKAENTEEKEFDLACAKIEEEKNELLILSEELNMLKKQEDTYKEVAEKLSNKLDMLDSERVSGKKEKTENSFLDGDVEELSKKMISCVFENVQGKYIDELKNLLQEHVELENDLQKETEWCSSELSIAEKLGLTAYTVTEAPHKP